MHPLPIHQFSSSSFTFLSVIVSLANVVAASVVFACGDVASHLFASFGSILYLYALVSYIFRTSVVVLGTPHLPGTTKSCCSTGGLSKVCISASSGIYLTLTIL